MKKILSLAVFAISIMAVTTSCNKEYTCQCDNGSYSQIVAANSQSDASAECDTKGDDCIVK